MTLQLNKKHLLFQIQRPKVSSQNIFWVTTEEKSKADLKQTFLERTKRHFGKLVFFFQWNRPKLFGGFVRKSSKQLHTIQNDEDHVSEKIKSCFFLSIRYRKTSQTQDVKSQSTERSVRKKGQPKRDSAFEQKTRIVSCREIWASSQNRFFLVTTKEKSPAELKKTILERTQRRFGKFLFCSRNKSCFYKYSISQDISNAGFKEPK